MTTIRTIRSKIDECPMSRCQRAILRREIKNRRNNLEKYPKTMELLERVIEAGDYRFSFDILKCIPRDKDKYPVYFYSRRLGVLAVGFSIELQNLKYALDSNKQKIVKSKLQKLKEIRDIYPSNVQPLLDDILQNLNNYLQEGKCV